MKAWLVTAIVGFSFACNSKPTEQASARSAEPAAPKAANSRTHRADLLRRLDDALRKAAPNIAARLRPGATDSQIAAFETYLGYPMPEALTDLYPMIRRASSSTGISMRGWRPSSPRLRPACSTR